jgi:lambda repressor-like predicted transcriptional regulator
VLEVNAARVSLRAATQHSDALIIEANADGWSLRVLAALAGVSHQTVANVVAAGASTTTETQCRPPV